MLSLCNKYRGARMSWQELETKQVGNPNPDAVAAQHRLEAACRKAISEDNPEFLKLLRRLAEAVSYTPGRGEADVAFAEGKRALAVYILRTGGFYV